jgi:hypothetical protein
VVVVSDKDLDEVSARLVDEVSTVATDEVSVRLVTVVGRQGPALAPRTPMATTAKVKRE